MARTEHNKKILTLDVEWKPTKAYVWQPWKQDITPDKIIEHGGLLCVAAKWLGSKDVYFFSEWEDSKLGMLMQIHALLEEADAVVTYNGDKYDLPKLNGEFALAGLLPTAPPTSIDLLKTVKKLGLFMNRLGFVGPLFGLGGKLVHHGFKLWVDVENGDERAQRTMRKYNIKDVKLTEKLYKRILPFIRNHPHLGNEKRECGACGSNHVQSRGFRRTKYFKIQRLQCQTCGSWSDGTRAKI